ncbi:MAG: hypothetical protein ACFB16_16360 [Phormidesmis sp.]
MFKRVTVITFLLLLASISSTSIGSTSTDGVSTDGVSTDGISTAAESGAQPTSESEPRAASFADWPPGTYRYTATTADATPHDWILRKSGSAVVGIELLTRQRRTAVLHCFRGQAEGDRITNITQVSPPYSPASEWVSGRTLDLSTLSLAEAQAESALSPAEQAALSSCLQLFWR